MSTIIKMMENSKDKKQYAKSFRNGNETINEVINSSISVVIKLLPYVIASILPKMFINDASQNISGILIFSVLVITGSMLNTGILVGLQLLFKPNKISNKQYLSNLKEPLTVSFVTQSSAVTSPYTIKALEKSGVDSVNATITPSIAASLGQISAGFYTIVLIFATASVQGTDIDATFIIMAFLMSVVTSFGVPGVPGGATAKNMAILTSMGLPTNFFLSTISIDFFLDMFQTQANISGAMAASQILNKIDKK